jgi:hypothetical protein
MVNGDVRIRLFGPNARERLVLEGTGGIAPL